MRIGKSVFKAEELEQRVLLSFWVTTYHNDLSSTGANLAETVLTPANVNSTTFGKLFSTPVDGQLYAQPLVVAGLSINGGSRNVAFVATEHDSVYAIDAQSGQVYWQKNFLNPGGGVTTVTPGEVNSTDLSPEMGITSTPVIDTSTNTIYVVAMTHEVIGGNTHYIYRLHAMDLATGAEKLGGPVLIGDTISDDGNSFTYVSGPSVAGNGDGAVNGVVHFNVLRERQRAALSLVNGVIYMAFASFGDTSPYHGWILGYDASNLQLAAVFCDNPNSNDDGIWGGGGRIASDSQGFLYFETGNGGFDSSLNAAGFPRQGDYGDSFVKLTVDSSTSSNPNINGWGLKVVDYFTPFNQQSLANGDTDLGSGDLVILPDSAGSAAHPHLLIGGGKEGRLYVIDRDNMGHYDPNTDHVVQEISSAVSGDLATPAYFNGDIFIAGGYNNDHGHSFSIANGVLTPLAATPDTFGFPGSTPSISANGNNNGIVWDLDKGSSRLRAYTASNYNNEIYNSSQAANGRDLLGTGVKFAVPTVANGEAFAGSGNALVVYGLLSVPIAAPAAPTNLTAAAVGNGQINLSWSDNSSNESGFLVEQSTDGVNFNQVGATGVGANTFTVSQLQPLTTYTYRVRAYNSVGNSDYTNNASAKTTASPPPGVLDFSSGFTGAGALLSINGPRTAVVNSRLRLTDGTNNETTSVFSDVALNVSQFSSQFQFQLTNALADGFTFTIQGAGPTAVGAGGGGLGYGYSPGISTTGGIPTSVAIKFDIYDNVGEGTDSTGMYLNGAGPGTPAVDLSNTGIVLRSGDIINAALNYDGTTLAVTLTDTVTGKTATQNYTVNIPKTVNGTTAFVGFTAGTGGSTAIEDILTWTFSPTSSSAQPAVPSSFTAVATSGTQTNLNWTENPAGASGFLIERATGSGAFSQVGTSATTSFMDTGLTTGQTYSYRVRAQNGSLLSGYSSVQTLVMPTIPAAPTNAHVTFVGSTEIDIAWTNNANNASGYRIYSQTTKSGPFNLLVTVPASASTYQNTGIPSGTLNNYDVEAFNIAGFSAPTTTAAVTIAAPPTALGVAAGSGQNTLSWTGSTGADTYNVYRGTSPGAEGNTPYKTGITATSFVDSSLATGVTYYYQVTAVDSGGESTSSNEAGATLQSQSGLRAGWTSADIGSPALAGSATSAGDGFTVQGGGSDIWGASDQFQFAYKPLSVDFTITAHVAGIVSTSPWTKAGVMIRESLAPNSNHAFMLLSSDNGVRLIYRDPAAPNSVDINPNTGSVSSYWVRLVRTGGSVTGFESADGVTWVQVGGPVPIATGTVYVGLAVTSHNAGALTTGTFDHVLITGSTVAPPPPTAPADPSNLQAGGTPGGTITLTWSDNSTNETGFAVDRATDANFTQNLKTSTVTSANPALTGTTTFTDTTTSAGVTYFYRVRAVNGSLASNNTATATAVGQTTNPSPTAPLPLTSLDIGGPAFPGSVNFNANSGVYTVTGGGSDIWWGKDQFQFDYMALPANGTIIAHVSGIGAANEWAKAGVMIRQSLSSSSNFAMMLLSESHGVHLQSRTAAFPNGFDADPKSGNQTSYWVKLIRSGGSVTGFESSDGINWVQVGAAVPMAGGTIFIGLAVTAHNNFTSTTASFDHVSITTP